MSFTRVLLGEVAKHIGEGNVDSLVSLLNHYFNSGGHMKQFTAIANGEWMKTKDGHHVRRTGTGWEVSL